MLFISTTETASLILTTALSRWIVVFVKRPYERLGIEMSQHILGFVLRCVHYPRILCQTGIYFHNVLVFQERTVGNISAVHYAETLVLHFIWSNEWVEYTRIYGKHVGGSCPAWFSDGESLSAGTHFTPLLLISTVADGFSRAYFETIPMAFPPIKLATVACLI